MNDTNNAAAQGQPTITNPITSPPQTPSPAPADGAGGVTPVPDIAEFEAMCAGLPDDCQKSGLAVIGGAYVCDRYSCKFCAPPRFRRAAEAGFATAVNRGLKHRLTVAPECDTQSSEEGLELKSCYQRLKDDAKLGAGHDHSYICSFSLGADGRMRLELFTNVDFRRGLVTCKRSSLDLVKLGRVARQLRAAGRFSIREVAEVKVRDEILAMVRGVVGLMSSGGRPPWWLSSSLDVGITQMSQRKRAADGAGTQKDGKGQDAA